MSNRPTGQFPGIDQNLLTITARSLGGIGSSKITLTDETDGSSIIYDFVDRENRSLIIPIGHHYEVEVDSVFSEDLLLFTGDCREVVDEPTSCKEVMQNQQQRVVIAFRLGPS